MFLALLSLLACSSGEGTTDPTAFEGGSFTFMTTGVTDECSDGAFDVIFMPEGTTEEWGTPVELPAWSELPKTYPITLQDPYGEIEVTVTAGDTDGQMVVSGAQANDVELDQYPGCVVNNSIDVDLTIVTNDEVEGTAVLHTSSMDEADCPTVQSGGESCDVTLDLMGQREGTEHDDGM